MTASSVWRLVGHERITMEIPQNRIYIADPMIYFYLEFLDTKKYLSSFQFKWIMS